MKTTKTFTETVFISEDEVRALVAREYGLEEEHLRSVSKYIGVACGIKVFGGFEYKKEVEIK